ncbi:hypothetical protein C8T65DRAFT_642729 [Cerioporus squamosus]|nr:hypothetical protein C8T65DRAFT_642729 [Cerioporus squamosus]
MDPQVCRTGRRLHTPAHLGGEELCAGCFVRIWPRTDFKALRVPCVRVCVCMAFHASAFTYEWRVHRVHAYASSPSAVLDGKLGWAWRSMAVAEVLPRTSPFWRTPPHLGPRLGSLGLEERARSAFGEAACGPGDGLSHRTRLGGSLDTETVTAGHVCDRDRRQCGEGHCALSEQAVLVDG